MATAEKEYIERVDLIKFVKKNTPNINGNTTMRSVERVMKAAPAAADVVEVRHGEWDIKSRSWRLIDDYDEEIYVECPFCKRTFYVPYELDDEKALAYARENYPYCHCGAKMDGERKAQP